MTLAHDVAGDPGDPAVVLLHAGVADRRMWDAVAPALAHTFRVEQDDGGVAGVTGDVVRESHAHRLDRAVRPGGRARAPTASIGMTPREAP